MDGECVAYDYHACYGQTAVIIDCKGKKMPQYCEICDDALTKAINSLLPTDVNRDGVVNIEDLAIIAGAFGSKPGDENWKVIANFDVNKEINILDIIWVAKDFGKKSCFVAA